MDAVIFDLDGTLLNSRKTILRCLNTTLAEYGFETFADEDLYSLIGMDLMEILKLKGANRPEVRERYTEIQFQTYQEDMTVYEGVLDLLKRLESAGYRMAAATMRRGFIAREVSSGLGLIKFFDTVVGADEVPEPKPSPHHTLRACEILDIRPENCIMVGDSELDILSAKAAGCTAIGVTWGMGSTRNLAKAKGDHIVDDIDALAELLLGLK
jgi:phosphoglycolate phosphatase